MTEGKSTKRLLKCKEANSVHMFRELREYLKKGEGVAFVSMNFMSFIIHGTDQSFLDYLTSIWKQMTRVDTL